MDKFFTTFETAKICHVSPGSVIRWIHGGRLPASVTPGGHHRVASKDLIVFLKQLRMPVPPELEGDVMKFLMITENVLTGRLLRKYAEGVYPGVLVEEAQDYFMAGWKASRFRPDLVILDLEFSSNGEIIKVCELMRAFFESKNTPLLVLASAPSPAAQKKILSLGQSDWLSKPLDKNQFAIKLADLLRRRIEVRRTGS